MRESLQRLTALFLLIAVLAVPALGYYDDVHYGLVYYIARQVGFTHWQAYRIASASSRVDWDSETEPVQVNKQLADALFFLGADVHSARMRFHSFRDESYPSQQVLGGERDGAVAQRQVDEALEKFYELAVGKHGNPGAYLHALADVEPHKGYGTLWGHNPGDYTFFDRVWKQNLPIGSSTDWVSFRTTDVVLLCNTLHARLAASLRTLSPYQTPRPFAPRDYPDLVAALALTNPYPAPFTRDEERQQFMYLAMTDRKAPIGPITVLLRGEQALREVQAELRKPDVAARMMQHLRGPNVERGYDEIDRALAMAGFRERLPRYPIEYDLKEDGGLYNPSLRDDWVLTGSAELSITGYQSVTARLYTDTLDGTGAIRRTPLKLDPVTIKGNSSYTWDKLPIGDVYAELTRQQGAPLTVRMSLNKVVNVFGPIPVGGAPPPTPTRLPVPVPEPPKPQTINTGDFNGTWDSYTASPFRIPVSLTISQTGVDARGDYKMEGRYTQAGKDVIGTIEGTVVGNTFKFKWKDNFNAEGTGVFELSKDGKEIRGRHGVGKAAPTLLWNANRK